MRKIIDLTAPIKDHFRWKLEQSHIKKFEDGELFQVTKVSLVVHSYTHLDCQKHMLQDGSTSTDIKLDSLVRPITVLDLTDVSDEEEITAERLDQASSHREVGDNILLKTEWDTRYSIETKEYWAKAPYISRDAAELIRSWEPKVVAFDFPQDYCIRKIALGAATLSIEEFVTHDILLRNGIHLVEYVVNTAEISANRISGVILPLKIFDSDGVPVRFIAIEDL